MANQTRLSLDSNLSPTNPRITPKFNNQFINTQYEDLTKEMKSTNSSLNQYQLWKPTSKNLIEIEIQSTYQTDKIKQSLLAQNQNLTKSSDQLQKSQTFTKRKWSQPHSLPYQPYQNNSKLFNPVLFPYNPSVSEKHSHKPEIKRKVSLPKIQKKSKTVDETHNETQNKSLPNITNILSQTHLSMFIQNNQFFSYYSSPLAVFNLRQPDDHPSQIIQQKRVSLISYSDNNQMKRFKSIQKKVLQKLKKNDTTIKQLLNKLQDTGRLNETVKEDHSQRSVSYSNQKQITIDQSLKRVVNSMQKLPVLQDSPSPVPKQKKHISLLIKNQLSLHKKSNTSLILNPSTKDLNYPKFLSQAEQMFSEILRNPNSSPDY